MKETERLIKRERVHFERKENRGRDLSALLVAFAPYMPRYRYLCFLHDKSAKHDYLKEDLSFWIKNLWGNMVSSGGYMLNVIDMLENRGYGALFPPKPVGEYMDAFYIDPWNNNYENVRSLAEELGIGSDISRRDAGMVTLGTAFWCRTDALEKLFGHGWKYENFPDEPMPDDGTVSHAIERILGFVALDAGYKIGTVMNAEYAAWLADLLQSKMEDTYRWLWENIGVKNTYQLERFDEEREKTAQMFEGHEKIFLYGAGFYGERYLQRLLFWGYRPYGFVVSDGRRERAELCGYKIYELSEVAGMGDYGLIITTNPDLQNEIARELERNKTVEYYSAVVV